MNRFERQERIAGWDQGRLRGGCVAVHGRDWVGAFTVWALASLGVGTVVWLGRACSPARAFADWLLADQGPAARGMIHDDPFDVEYGPEMELALGGAPVALVLSCAEDPQPQAVCRDFARGRGVPCLAGVTAAGGWFGRGEPPAFRAGPQDPVTALAVAGLLADGARQALCPLPGDLPAPAGPLGLEPPAPADPPADGTLIGVGGIGVYAATALAARGHGLHLVDHDRVEASNLNRQGLFTHADAQAEAPKASAARQALARLFPQARLTAEVRRVGRDYGEALGRLRPRPAALLSAVDNARTRLLLQDLGRELGLPVVQGGTDTFAADCFTQDEESPLLDEQLHGALAAAAAREVPRGRGAGCAGDPSYVVPGMMAAALMAYRFAQVGAAQRHLPPLHWRAGDLPMPQRRPADAFDFTGPPGQKG